MFVSRIPKWGGIFVDKNNNNTSISLTNTCTIDYFLLALWTTWKLSKNWDLSTQPFAQINSNIQNIINSIENLEWDRAKSIWIRDIVVKYKIEVTLDILFQKKNFFMIKSIF